MAIGQKLFPTLQKLELNFVVDAMVDPCNIFRDVGRGEMLAMFAMLME